MRPLGGATVQSAGVGFRPGRRREEPAVHETRNFCLVIVLVTSIAWAFVAWLMLSDDAPFLWEQRNVSLILIVATVACLIYAFKFEDKYPDHLKALVDGPYYEADGLSFMPVVQASGGQAELSVYYQNRYENPVQAIVHLRPPQDSFVIRRGMRDAHFAFRAGGGDFGVIHQPIAVPEHLQGKAITVQLAAASHYPRSQGVRWRRRPGRPCGTLMVDWEGAAFKSGVHEVSGELELIDPVTLQLVLPTGVSAHVAGNELWKQEQLTARRPRVKH